MKPYKMPKKYVSWAKFQADRNRMSLYSPEPFTEFSLPSMCENISYLYNLHSQGYPVYCVRESLLDDMLKTDVGENIALFSDIKLSIPSYVLFLPNKAILSPINNGVVDYLVVYHQQIESKEYKHIISWGGIDSKNSMIFGAKRIRNDGTIQRSYFATDDKERQNNCLSLRNIVMQSILLMQFYPDVDQPMEVFPSKEKGFSRTVDSNFLLPRWLGKEKGSANNSGGNGSGKSTHFRRGHWRNLENRIIWVRPAWINKE